MATEAACYRAAAPALHYVTSGDDVVEWGGGGERQVRGGAGLWWSQQLHHRGAEPAMARCPPPPHHAVAAPPPPSSCRRKLSVDDSPSRRAVNAGSWRPRPPVGSSATAVNALDCDQQRRRSSPRPSWRTLSRTLSEQTLHDSRYEQRSAAAAAAAECRDDLLDDWRDASAADDALTETFLSPPRIAPVSGQLSLVSIMPSSYRPPDKTVDAPVSVVCIESARQVRSIRRSVSGGAGTAGATAGRTPTQNALVGRSGRLSPCTATTDMTSRSCLCRVWCADVNGRLL